MGNIYEVCCIQSSSTPTPLTEPKKTQPFKIIKIRQAEIPEPAIKQLTWESFQPVRYLCKSELAKVAIVRLKANPNSKQYIMKIVEKSKIKENNLLQDSNIQNVVLSAENPFLTKIFHISQNRINIHIVMEYIPGRDIYYFLTEEEQQNRKIPEETIRQVVAEAILGLQFLHSKGIIYRQLKPQNLLCTSDGHIKLTDYVLSRLEKKNQPTLTYLGNIQYTAPQMLSKNKGYNRFADLWSLGILLYELRIGSTPFHGNDARQIQQKIKMGSIQFPSDVAISQNLKNLILQLTNIEPQRRPNLQQVKKHPFFAQLDWQQVQQRKNNTGLLQIMSNYDLSIRGQNDNPPARIYITESDRKQASGPFFEFTCPTEQSFRQQ